MEQTLGKKQVVFNIVCYGDSNTWGVDTENNLKRIPYEKRWTGLLAKKLGENYHIYEEGLQGRTTVFEDPLGYGRNGEAYLDVAILTHDPVNLLVIMLGTNDMKDFFHATAQDSAWGVERLIIRAKKVFPWCESANCKILVVSPIELSATENGEWCYGFSEEAVRKSKELAKYNKTVAERHGCEFVDAAQYAAPSVIDGTHIANSDQENLADALAEKIRGILP